MLKRILRDLTVSDLTWGGGPLALAVLAFVRAALAGEPFNRWAWITCGVVMLVVCAAYLAWVWRRRSDLAAAYRSAPGDQ
ncbi:hypothetical protein AMIS_61780 [Actinoplanes missouriensis 431]|uniref:Uncharacterized protein n=1 Tax=Actinoplanes missouriensis (strain ATCC 14538 / DSM 43046 / CBS 188.64 / JCM 3121 / NBRC 102363 / NCIMB 12654 / NRRL B-3342 / UNCC 431) TaxID=512565 RepID=I0HEG1_ACTM4|nr:hypothetical protein [Actinoplanes missouriensis]BAL91398.1 hypothetical protein AMIS_61780 [Actinoplanes missouriensis 431]